MSRASQKPHIIASSLTAAALCLAALCPLNAAAATDGEAKQARRNFKLSAVVVDGGRDDEGRSPKGSGMLAPGMLGPGQELDLRFDQDGGNACFNAPKAGASLSEVNWGKDFGAGPWTVAQNPDSKPEAGSAPKTDAKAEGQAEKSATQAPAGKSLDGPSVDWSGWIAHMADRWYDRLVTLEKQANRNYTTRRPARIKFTVYPDGHVDKISLLRTCGVTEYDKMQIEALKQAAPFDPFPAGSNRKDYTLAYGWESHARKKGEVDFKPGSYRKFPTEKLKVKNAPPTLKVPAKPAEKAPAKPAEKAPAKPAEKAPAKPAEKAPAKPAEKAPAKPAEKAPAKK